MKLLAGLPLPVNRDCPFVASLPVGFSSPWWEFRISVGWWTSSTTQQISSTASSTPPLPHHRDQSHWTASFVLVHPLFPRWFSAASGERNFSNIQNLSSTPLRKSSLYEWPHQQCESGANDLLHQNQSLVLAWFRSTFWISARKFLLFFAEMLRLCFGGRHLEHRIQKSLVAEVHSMKT